MNSFRISALLSLALVGACVADPDALTIDETEAPLAAGVRTVKVSFSRVTTDTSAAVDEPGVVPFTTASDYRDYLGERARGVSFPREWAVAFSADQPGNQCASIASIDYVPSTRRLTVTTELKKASWSCPSKRIHGRPYTLVKFKVPSPTPLYFSFNSIGATNPGQPSGPGTACAQRTGGALVTIAVGQDSPEEYAAWVTNPEFIATAKALKASGEHRNPSFKVVDGSSCDARYGFSVDPDDAEFAEFSIEVCDATPSYLSANKGEWLSKNLRWCPWGAHVVSVDER